MEPDRIWNVVTNPAWRPLTNADVPGYIVLAVCAGVLVCLTLWTYLGSAQTTPRRMFILIFLRLLALLIAILTALRPSLAVTEQPRQESTLIIALDTSKSMSITDEYNKLNRWEVMRNVMEKCEPLLKQLASDQQVKVYVYTFSSEFDATAEQYSPLSEDKKEQSIVQWLAKRGPEGKQTDFGGMLAKLYDRFQSEKNPIRGFVVISDGGNNVNTPDPIAQALRWRGIGCPIYGFMVGRSDTRSDYKDIAFTSISPDPSPVAVKADLVVKGMLNAAGLENSTVKVRVVISSLNGSTSQWEDLPDLTRTESFRLTKAANNEIEIATKAPDKPGEVKVRMEIIDPPPEDRNPDNNHIETYLTVTKDGVRVLVIDRLRPELTYLRRALASDKRFDFVELVRQTDDPPLDGRKFDILGDAYDAIILGDVSPGRLRALNPELMNDIDKLVREKGVGLMMMGGIDSFGGTPGFPGSDGWRSTPIERLLPVDLPPPTPQADGSTEIIVSPKGYEQYIMKLDPDRKKNEAMWARLGKQATTRLGGFTVIGKPKDGATLFASARRVENNTDELPLLVGRQIGKGRVLAFGADQTWKWRNLGTEEGSTDEEEGVKLHARFWKQTVLWLAHQEEVEGNVYVQPAQRRMAVNGKNELRFGIKGKHGDRVVGPKIRYQVLAPGENVDEKKAKSASRADKNEVLAEYEPKAPGEYRVIAWGQGKEADGSEIKGDAESRFVVYPEVSGEMIDPRARDDFLLELEKRANGDAPQTVRKADDLPGFLKDRYLDKPLKKEGLKPKLHPDWRRSGTPWFLPVLLVGFVLVLSLEWGLRRIWGMV